jgi:hypothetical protein
MPPKFGNAGSKKDFFEQQSAAQKPKQNVKKTWGS